MKYLSLFIFMILIFSCEKKESIWDELTEAEKEQIRLRSQAKCRDENQIYYNNFKVLSNQFFESTAYARGKGFIFKELVSGNAIREVDLRVWKRTDSTIYFLVNDFGNTYFLKLTAAENEDFITDLFDLHCENTDSVSITGLEGPVRYSFAYKEPYGTEDTKHILDTYDFNFKQIAFVGVFSLTSKREVKNEKDEVLSTTNVTSTFAAKTYTQVWNDTTTTNISEIVGIESVKYCVINETGTPLRYRPPYIKGVNDIDLGRLTCVPQPVPPAPPAPPAGWDLSI